MENKVEGAKLVKGKIYRWIADIKSAVKKKWELLKTYFLQEVPKAKKELVMLSIFMCGITSGLSLFSVNGDVQEINKEQKVQIRIIEHWYAQLPEEHWIRKEVSYRDLNTLYTACISTEKAIGKLEKVTISQIDNIGEFVGKGMERIDSRKRELYCLKYKDTDERVKKLKVNAGERMRIKFCYNDAEMLFDFTKEQLAQNIATRVVYSYVEDTTIATIYNGEVTAWQKGKTKLHLYCNGYHFQYIIKVI